MMWQTLSNEQLEQRLTEAGETLLAAALVRQRHTPRGCQTIDDVLGGDRADA
jgi:hypothetical protein